MNMEIKASEGGAKETSGISLGSGSCIDRGHQPTSANKGHPSIVSTTAIDKKPALILITVAP
jgi:hypothetical protein